MPSTCEDVSPEKIVEFCLPNKFKSSRYDTLNYIRKELREPYTGEGQDENSEKRPYGTVFEMFIASNEAECCSNQQPQESVEDLMKKIDSV